MASFSAWLDSAALSAFVISATFFVALNVGAAALVFLKRDRAIVNRWTASWLVANLLLIGTGVGLPIAAKVVRLTSDAVAAAKAIKPVPDTDVEPRPK